MIRLAPHERASFVSKLGFAALAVANGDIGKGETTGNNRGPYCWTIRGKRTGGAWCAAAVYHWVQQGANAIGQPFPVKRTHGARKLIARLLEAGAKQVYAPLPGDIVLWARGAPWQGHVGIIDHTEGDDFLTVEGNVGRFPATVQVFQHHLAEPKLVKIVRLP